MIYSELKQQIQARSCWFSMKVSFCDFAFWLPVEDLTEHFTVDEDTFRA